MNKTLLRRALIVGALLSAASLAPKAQAQDEIALFNFNSSTTTVSRGTGTLTTSFTAQGATAGTTYFTGTTVNAQDGDVAGQALAVVGQGNNGQNLTIAASTATFTGIYFSFAIQKTSTGFGSDQFQYSTDGTTFTNFGAAFVPQGSFTGAAATPTIIDLTSITALNNNPNAAFRIVFSGATATSGNNRLDNILVSDYLPVAPAPEPSGTASILVGAALMGGLLCMARRRTAGHAQAA